ncbi:hypothetical protein IZY60_13350 [Lutibacter sp. B2]|nr:hypothetical protein [Lutibacter sp. B2]
MPKLEGLKTDELRRATFLLTDEIYDALRLKCLLEGKQVNDFARRILCAHIDQKYFKQINENRAAKHKELSTNGSKQLLGKQNSEAEEMEEL